VWQDVQVWMSTEPEMLTVGIVTIRATNRNTKPHSPAEHRGESTFMDILPMLTGPGLTPHTTFDAYNIIVNTFSRFGKIYGSIGKSAEQVMISCKECAADYGLTSASECQYINIDRIRSDADSQFTSIKFKVYHYP
jgi:hypothetical protein